MNWTIAAGGLVAVGTFITALVMVAKARPEAKKLRADGTATLLTAMTANNAELADQVAELRTETQRLWQAQRAQEDRITAHVRWDRHVVDALRGLGQEISDPPPLYTEGT